MVKNKRVSNAQIGLVFDNMKGVALRGSFFTLLIAKYKRQPYFPFSNLSSINQ